MSTDWLVVGAGYTGAVIAERIATQLGQQVLVVDRRPHIAGNAYDYVDEHGVLVHAYGPHIFHTNVTRVWEYLSQFTEWRPYEHKTLASIDGQLVPVPFNLNTLDALFPERDAKRLTDALVSEFGLDSRVPILKLRASVSGELADLAEFVYEKVFLGYTTKQWGRTPEQLSSSVTARVPVVIGRDDRYFNDRYQAMPIEGYTAMFERILDHPNITVLLDTDARDVIAAEQSARIVYSGAIDELFDHVFGPLPYRSLRFEPVHDDVDRAQPSGIVNYPNDHEYTRITEFKHLTGQQIAGTTRHVEYPIAHEPGRTVPYYPVPVDEALRHYRQYVDLATAEAPHVVFAGRLADYRYYNMDQAVFRALSVFDRRIAPLAAGGELPPDDLDLAG